MSLSSRNIGAMPANMPREFAATSRGSETRAGSIPAEASRSRQKGTAAAVLLGAVAIACTVVRDRRAWTTHATIAVETFPFRVEAAIADAAHIPTASTRR